MGRILGDEYGRMRCPRCGWPRYEMVGVRERPHRPPAVLRRCEACLTEWESTRTPEEKDIIENDQ